jgi:hypothetical protein
MTVKDPDPNTLAKKNRKTDAKKKGKDATPLPIVVSRYHFKSDGEGYLGEPPLAPVPVRRGGARSRSR